jgi:restriction system protein
MGIRFSTGVGPFRISVPLTPRFRRRRQRRTARRAVQRRTTYRAPARRPAAAAAVPQRPNLLVRMGWLGWGIVCAVLGLGSITKPMGILFLLAGGVMIWYGIRQRQAAQAFAAQQGQIAHARSMEIAPYHAMDPRRFEHAIAYLCERDGCTSVQVVGGAGDLGADVIATAPDGRRIVLQCKRYGPTTKVGSQDMQRFGGTCYTVHGAAVAAVVTTSTFTRPAAQYAAGMRIGLFDHNGLAGWASRTGPAPWM